MKTGAIPTAKVTGAGAVTWICASNDVQFFSGTDKANIDTSKCLQSILS